MLRVSGFLRVHRSHLVNAYFISVYDPQGVLQLSNDSQLEVSRRKKML
jgi:DNA-binding LytR/AlgR family response regulator